MTLFVHTEGRNLFIESDTIKTCISHRIPKRNKYFKEELRMFRKEIQTWLCGSSVDEIRFDMYHDMTFYHSALYQAVLQATFPPNGLALVHVEIKEEDEDDNAGSNQYEPEL